MAVALSTSKRKFDKLLDNLTNDSPRSSRPNSAGSLSRTNIGRTSNDTISPTSNPTTETNTTPAAKRLRGSPQSIREIARERLEAKKKAAAAEAEARAQALASSIPARRQPNYIPWSHDVFLARLKTFADVKLWTPKPDVISEVEWAKRGWVCEGINRVACKGGCECRVVVRLRPKWRRAGCKTDIYHLPLAKRSYWQQGLLERYKSLEGIKEQLPARIGTPEGARSLESLVERLPAGFFGEEEPSQAAVEFALYGWRGEMFGSTALASCPHCFSRIGLWMYKREETQGTKAHSNDLPALNLVENHRYHCPWRNASSQASPGELKGLAGWQVLQKVITNSRRPPSEIPQLLDEPQTPRPVSVGMEPATPDGAMSRVESPIRPTTADLVAADKARLSKLARLKRMMSFKTKPKK
ncbi:zf-C3HC-domain-containing protein [Viridothelium virens]|uniref:Zf-C3HC-domain-containing protein n=1 Tax=Viridothelium virens TaxID=1048519 RepID=A0A6A6HN53_VIRVR|nr:zf-C3HC-domain-containing protein [Viridothelium virens]